MSTGPNRAPCLSSAQARRVDQLVAERFRIPVAWLMEAAGWQVARQVSGPAYVLCGKGNNGGDGLAAARHLLRWGRLTGVACVDVEAMTGPARDEALALQALGVRVAPEPDIGHASVVVDALLGTGLSRPPEGKVAAWIEAVNAASGRVVSVDVPSGLDADTGATPGACVDADVTVTLGLPKTGLLSGEGPRMAGEVWVADIGIPLEVYRELSIDVPVDLFSKHDRVRLDALGR